MFCSYSVIFFFSAKPYLCGCFLMQARWASCVIAILFDLFEQSVHNKSQNVVSCPEKKNTTNMCSGKFLKLQYFLMISILSLNRRLLYMLIKLKSFTPNFFFHLTL